MGQIAADNNNYRLVWLLGGWFLKSRKVAPVGVEKPRKLGDFILRWMAVNLSLIYRKYGVARENKQMVLFRFV